MYDLAAWLGREAPAGLATNRVLACLMLWLAFCLIFFAIVLYGAYRRSK